MKTNENFLIAKKDKNLQSLLIIQRDGKKIMRLCVDTPIKYTDKKETVFIETDTEIRIENYSSYDNNGVKTPVDIIVFHCSTYSNNYVVNFLNTIRKDSEVSFKVVAYNGCDVHRNMDLVHHTLYGIIDNKEFMLSDYVGHSNSTRLPV